MSDTGPELSSQVTEPEAPGKVWGGKVWEVTWWRVLRTLGSNPRAAPSSVSLSKAFDFSVLFSSLLKGSVNRGSYYNTCFTG